MTSDAPLFAWVTERIGVGRRARTIDDVSTFVRAGITHWVDHSRTEIEPGWLGEGPHYLWNPAADDGAHKSDDWFDRTYAFIEPVLAADGRALVSCAQGIHRGPSVMSDLLVRLDGISLDEAIASIKAVWPSADPIYARR